MVRATQQQSTHARQRSERLQLHLRSVTGFEQGDLGQIWNFEQARSKTFSNKTPGERQNPLGGTVSTLELIHQFGICHRVVPKERHEMRVVNVTTLSELRVSHRHYCSVVHSQRTTWAAPVVRSAQYASRFLLTGGCKIERTRPGTGIRARNAGAHGCTRVSSR